MSPLSECRKRMPRNHTLSYIPQPPSEAILGSVVLERSVRPHHTPTPWFGSKGSVVV